MNGGKEAIAGVLLAGGLARRMGGGDKCLVELAGRPLLAHIIDRMAPQTPHLAINANGDPQRFADFDLPVIADTVEGFAGPLAGILAGLEWVSATQPDASHMVSVATDTPFFPSDLVERLDQGARMADCSLAVAVSAARTHPVFGLWPVALLEDLRMAVAHEGLRKVDTWTARHGVAEVVFGASDGDPFFNINAPEDMAEAEARLATQPGAKPVIDPGSVQGQPST